jgi:predicted DCC family thiol-disulfide oxidoreductase YuxK
MPESPMLVFDGECAFCDRVVRFILAHERRNDLRFVPRASPLGLALREQYHLQRVESILWIADNRASVAWGAVAHIAAYVGGIYARLGGLASLLPRALLTAGYRLIARIRKRLAGRPRQCMLLTPAQQERFLE